MKGTTSRDTIGTVMPVFIAAFVLSTLFWVPFIRLSYRNAELTKDCERQLGEILRLQDEVTGYQERENKRNGQNP